MSSGGAGHAGSRRSLNFARLMRRRPRGARRLSVRRADRPRRDRRASPQAPLRRGAQAYAGAIRRVPTGSPRRGRADRNRRALVQRKRRPTSNVDSMMVLRARRGRTGSKYVTLRGGRRRAIPFLLVRSGGCARDARMRRRPGQSRREQNVDQGVVRPHRAASAGSAHLLGSDHR